MVLESSLCFFVIHSNAELFSLAFSPSVDTTPNSPLHLFGDPWKWKWLDPVLYTLCRVAFPGGYPLLSLSLLPSLVSLLSLVQASTSLPSHPEGLCHRVDPILG